MILDLTSSLPILIWSSRMLASSWKFTGFAVLALAKTGLISAVAGKGHSQDMEVYSVPSHVIARDKRRTRESLVGRRHSFQLSQRGGGSQLKEMFG